MLYRIGLEQSYQSERVAVYSILTFHDAVEMFLVLASEHHGIKNDKFTFIEYWQHLPSLTLRESMKNLNKTRVNIKHHGLLPAKLQIETCRVNTSDFFQQNSHHIFNIEFTDVSLFEMIQFETVKSRLVSAQSALDTKDYQKCASESAIAFYDNDWLVQ